MRHLLTLVLFLILPLASLASPDASLGPTSAPGVVSADPSLRVVSGPASVEVSVERTRGGVIEASEPAVLEQVGAVVKGAKTLKMDGATVVGIATFVASLVGLGISLVRKYGGKLLTQSQVNYTGIVLAAVATGSAAIAAGFVPGMEWWQVVIIGGSPLMTTLGHGEHDDSKSA